VVVVVIIAILHVSILSAVDCRSFSWCAH